MAQQDAPAEQGGAIVRLERERAGVMTGSFLHPAQILRRHSQMQPGFGIGGIDPRRRRQQAVAFAAVAQLNPQRAQLVMGVKIARHPRQQFAIGGGGLGEASGGEMGGGGVAQMPGRAHRRAYFGS